MTNEEKIKNMNIVELARFIDTSGCGCCAFILNCARESGCQVDCVEGIVEWLKQEALRE